MTHKHSQQDEGGGFPLKRCTSYVSKTTLRANDYSLSKVGKFVAVVAEEANVIPGVTSRLLPNV